MRAAYDGWHGLMLLIPRKLPMPDAGGRTSSVKTWFACIRTLNQIFTFFIFCTFLSVCKTGEAISVRWCMQVQAGDSHKPLSVVGQQQEQLANDMQQDIESTDQPSVACSSFSVKTNDHDLYLSLESLNSFKFCVQTLDRNAGEQAPFSDITGLVDSII